MEKKCFKAYNNKITLMKIQKIYKQMKVMIA